MSQQPPAHVYLDALGRELRVGWRYRRRVLAEIAAHIEDASEREQLRGGSVEEAQTRALHRLGPVESLASEVSSARQQAVAIGRERAVHRIAYLGAALVLACSFLAHATARDADGHLGLEVAVAAIAAGAVLLVDGWRGASSRIGLVLAGVAAVWIAAVLVLVSEGGVAFCAQVLGALIGAAAITHIARRVRWREGRAEL